MKISPSLAVEHGVTAGVTHRHTRRSTVQHAATMYDEGEPDIVERGRFDPPKHMNINLQVPCWRDANPTWNQDLVLTSPGKEYLVRGNFSFAIPGRPMFYDYGKMGAQQHEAERARLRGDLTCMYKANMSVPLSLFYEIPDCYSINSYRMTARYFSFSTPRYTHRDVAPMIHQWGEICSMGIEGDGFQWELKDRNDQPLNPAQFRAGSWPGHRQFLVEDTTYGGPSTNNGKVLISPVNHATGSVNSISAFPTGQCAENYLGFGMPGFRTIRLEERGLTREVRDLMEVGAGIITNQAIVALEKCREYAVLHEKGVLPCVNDPTVAFKGNLHDHDHAKKQL